MAVRRTGMTIINRKIFLQRASVRRPVIDIHTIMIEAHGSKWLSSTPTNEIVEVAHLRSQFQFNGIPTHFLFERDWVIMVASRHTFFDFIVLTSVGAGYICIRSLIRFAICIPYGIKSIIATPHVRRRQGLRIQRRHQGRSLIRTDCQILSKV